MTHTQRVETLAEPIAEAYRRLPYPVLLTCPDGLLVSVNPAAETLYAYSSAELCGKPLSLIAPTLNGAIIEKMVRSSPDGKWETEIVGVRKGGARFRAKLNVSSLTDRGGSYLGCVCTAHDLSELSRLRADLRRDEKELTVLARIGRITSSKLDIDEVYERVAQEVRQLIPCDIISIGAVDRESGIVTSSYVTGLGVPEGEQRTTIEIQWSIAEKVLLEATGVLFQPGGEDEVARSFPALTRLYGAGVRSFLAVPLIADGVVGVLQLGSCAVRAFGQSSLEVAGRAASQLAGAVFNSWLSAELEEAQTAAAQSERSFRELFDYAPVGYHDVDTQGCTVQVNQTLGHMLRYLPEQMLGRHISDFMEDAPQVHEMIGDSKAVAIGSGQSSERRLIRQDQSRVPVLVEQRVLRDDRGSITGVRATIHDITERTHLEGRLFESQRMEALGLLVGGVAHDFNNLSTAIMNYAEMGLMRAPKQGLLGGYFEEIRRASGRAANLTRQLLAFSRRRMIAPEVVDLNRIILDVEQTLRHVIRENIELVTLLDPGLRMIKVDPNQMEQVLLNLAVNASDAMPRGGKLVIATCNIYVPEELAQNQAHLSVGPSVRLSVSDSGVGMTEDVKARIFEPFFTTKDQGKGTGLGLASCHGIIAQSGGLITVESEPGRGTTFNIYLPAVEDTAGSPPSGEHPETAPVGTESILLAEDDPFIRSVSGGMLRDLGYSVFEAENGVDALDNARSLKEGRIDLLVADVVMPLMGGAKLATKLAETHPEAKVLLMSGYLDGDTVRNALLAEGREFIQKPFSSLSLARKVRDVIDA